MKKNIFAIVLLSLALATLSAVAAAGNVPEMPRTLSNARFVYVTAYDGDQFNPNLLPEDRDAIARVQDGIEKWGKLIVVYRPQEADIILAVQSRPSEDVLAVYDAHSGDWGTRPSQQYLWRVMGRGGLQKSEVPLFSQFEKAWDKMTK
ncbi:MAG TPA: hypothetical protein VJW96_09405 [Terriglobales bacterium]|jgi:hypothetical protein|nr:hypothetical protein [Terriglobales bacterium]